MLYGLACVSGNFEGWGSLLRVTFREGHDQSHAPVFRCRDGEAPIHKAAYGGHFSCVELLLSRNADVNAQTKCVMSIATMTMPLGDFDDSDDCDCVNAYCCFCLMLDYGL